ncbi:hypothetical protein [Fodinicurvata halophila]
MTEETSEWSEFYAPDNIYALTEHRNYIEPENSDERLPNTYPSELREVFLRYSQLLNKKKGWDGYRGKPISTDSFYFSLILLQYVLGENQSVKAQVVPLSYGGVQIEWHSLKGDLEIEIERANRFRVYFEDVENEEVLEFEGTNNFTNVQALLSRL